MENKFWIIIAVNFFSLTGKFIREMHEIFLELIFNNKIEKNVMPKAWKTINREIIIFHAEYFFISRKSTDFYHRVFIHAIKCRIILAVGTPHIWIMVKTSEHSLEIRTKIIWAL